jgi:hypothetical protein
MITNRFSWVALTAGFLAVACGGGTPTTGSRSASNESGPAPEGPAAEAPSGTFGYGQPSQSARDEAPSAAPPAAESKAGAMRSSPEFEPRDRDVQAEERPGLGTQWGETRDSRVSTAPFSREDPDSPFAVAQIHYNDAEGVRAMARRSGVAHFGDGASRVAGGALTVRLLDSNGQPLSGFDAGRRSYVMGEHGARYIIQIRNHTGHRVEAVATVDGLDVINGRAGALTNRGYIVNPFATVEIDGFRRSLDQVAAFRFGTVRGSYAAQKGDDRNVGVIGVVFFEEAGSNVRWTDFEVDRRHDADPFPGRFSSPPPGRF